MYAFKEKRLLQVNKLINLYISATLFAVLPGKVEKYRQTGKIRMYQKIAYIAFVNDYV